jgi:hypothetical protein
MLSSGILTTCGVVDYCQRSEQSSSRMFGVEEFGPEAGRNTLVTM